MGGIKQRWLITIFNNWRSVTSVTLSHGDMEVCYKRIKNKISLDCSNTFSLFFYWLVGIFRLIFAWPCNQLHPYNSSYQARTDCCKRFFWLTQGLYQRTTRMNVIPSGAVPIKPHSKGVVPVRPRTEMRIFCFVKCDPMKPQLNWILEIIEIPFDFHKFNKTVVGRGSFKPQPN